MPDNSHAERKIKQRRARLVMKPVFSLSDALDRAEIERDSSHRVLSLCELEPGDYPRVKADFVDVEGK